MSLWYCSDCKIAFAPGPQCPRCGAGGVWQAMLTDGQEPSGVRLEDGTPRDYSRPGRTRG